MDMVFDVALDTAAGRVNQDILMEEVLASGITTGLPITNMSVEGGSLTGPGQVTGGTLTISFTGAPSAADQATVTATVAAHTGDAFGPPVQRAEDMGVSSTALGSFQTKLSATPTPLQQGDYVLDFYCEIRVQSVIPNSGVRARVTVGGAEIAEDNWDLDQWHAFSGSISRALPAGATAPVVIEFQRIGAPNTVEIRRARLILTLEAT